MMMLPQVFVLLVVVSAILPRNAANHLLTTTEAEFNTAQPTAAPPAQVATTISDSKHCRDNDDSGCGSPKQQHGLNGTFTSMNYPGNYTNNANCTWIITVPSGFRVRISFPGLFDIERDWRCRYDSVSVYEDILSTTQIGKHCRWNPSEITSQDNDLAVVFTSDSDTVGLGFLLEWTAVPLGDASPTPGYDRLRPSTQPSATAIATSNDEDEDSGCGSPKQQRGLNGRFSSMNYPNNYTNNANCIWNITVPSRFRVRIHFSSLFDIETHSNCSYDSVSVYDSSSTTPIGVYCHRPSYNIMSQDNNVLVEFKSDSSVVRRGFLLAWTAAIRSSDSGCRSGYFQSGTSGSISSMNYPYGNYHNGADCAWLISVPDGMRVRLEFEGKFEIESSEGGSCNFDSVAVRGVDPSGVFGKTYGIFCGFSVPKAVILSDDNDIAVQFKSDGTTTYAGFSLKWDAAHACAFPSNPHNGTVSLSDEGRVHSKATYSCNYGFKLVGVNRRCLPSGRWSGTPPRCQEI